LTEINETNDKRSSGQNALRLAKKKRVQCSPANPAQAGEEAVGLAD